MAPKGLPVGAEVPDFSLENESGETINFYEQLEKSVEGVVLFVYPKADTPGCTRQACGFRDHFEDLAKAGYKLFGLSRDKAPLQARWKEKNELPYHLLCEGGAVLSILGCGTASSTERSVFVIGKDRKIILSRIKISPDDSVKAAMEVTLGSKATPPSKQSSESEGKKGGKEAKAEKPRGRPPRERAPSAAPKADTKAPGRRSPSAKTSARKPAEPKAKARAASGAAEAKRKTAEQVEEKEPKRARKATPKASARASSQPAPKRRPGRAAKAPDSDELSSRAKKHASSATSEEGAAPKKRVARKKD